MYRKSWNACLVENNSTKLKKSLAKGLGCIFSESTEDYKWCMDIIMFGELLEIIELFADIL